MPRVAEPRGIPPARFADPEATIRTFAAALRNARLGRAIECFAAESVLVTPDATAVSGRDGIGGLLAQLIDQRAEIVADPAGAVVAGDLAFVNQRWQLTLGSAENRHSQDVMPLLVLRRVMQEWKLAIVAPWGRP